MKHPAALPIIDIKKYGGKQIAIAEGKIIAEGKTLSGVLAKAKRRLPHTPLVEIRIFSVPKTLMAIYYA